MSSRPASQLADDGEAVGTPVPAAYDPSSAEPPVTDGGARKSVARAPDGPAANVPVFPMCPINWRAKR